MHRPCLVDGSISMKKLVFRPIGFVKSFISGILYSAFMFLMFRYGFEYDPMVSAWKALGSGFLFGIMFWFAMSMLGEGGVSTELRKNSWAVSN